MGTVQEDDTVFYTMSGSTPLSQSGSLKRTSKWVSSGMSKITEKTVPGGMLMTTGKYDLAQDWACEDWFTKPRCRVKWVRFPLSSHFVMFEETEEFIRTVGSFLEMSMD